MLKLIKENVITNRFSLFFLSHTHTHTSAILAFSDTPRNECGVSGEGGSRGGVGGKGLLICSRVWKRDT